MRLKLENEPSPPCVSVSQRTTVVRGRTSLFIPHERLTVGGRQKAQPQKSGRQSRPPESRKRAPLVEEGSTLPANGRPRACLWDKRPPKPPGQREGNLGRPRVAPEPAGPEVSKLCFLGQQVAPSVFP